MWSGSSSNTHFEFQCCFQNFKSDQRTFKSENKILFGITLQYIAFPEGNRETTADALFQSRSLPFLNGLAGLSQFTTTHLRYALYIFFGVTDKEQQKLSRNQ